MYSDIINTISTTEEADTLHDQINAFLALVYQDKGKPFMELIDQTFPGKLAPVIKEHLQKNQQELSFESIQTFFDGLTQALDTAKILRITLAVKPSVELTGLISKWMHDTLPGEQMLLAIDVDPSIHGGLVLIHEGKYIDVSLTKQVEQWFAARMQSQAAEAAQS